jgi:hypothetical protein
MTEDELRALVRDAVARHLGGRTEPAASQAAVPAPLWRSHASFGKYLLPTGSDQDGPCLIEPTASCNHCGYCLSHGH